MSVSDNGRSILRGVSCGVDPIVRVGVVGLRVTVDVCSDLHNTGGSLGERTKGVDPITRW